MKRIILILLTISSVIGIISFTLYVTDTLAPPKNPEEIDWYEFGIKLEHVVMVLIVLLMVIILFYCNKA